MYKIIVSFILLYTYGMICYNLGIKKGETIIYAKQEIEEIDYNNIIINEYEEARQEKKQVSKIHKKTSNKAKSVLRIEECRYRVSENGKNLIKGFEGLSLKSYRDADGFSIGYGHHTSDIKENQYITKKEAETLFEKDIEMVTISLNRLLNNVNRKNNIEYEFSQDFIDGFASLIYNCGEASIQATIFYDTLLNKCRWQHSDKNVLRDDILYTLSLVKKTRIPTQAHVNRRQQEYNLMIRNI